jgi:competence protein ComEC
MPFVVPGCFLGLAWGQGSVAPRESAQWWMPALAALVVLVAAAQSSHRLLSRLCVGVALCALFTTYAARRVVPPAHDVSSLVQATRRADLPLRPLPVMLQGRIRGEPKLGDWGQSFVLDCERVESTLKFSSGPVSGMVWIDAPREARLADGQLVTIQTELVDLPRSGHQSERVRMWRYILRHCWCRARVKDAGAIRIVQDVAPNVFAARLQAWRRAITQRYERDFLAREVRYPRATAQLMTAMVFGEGGLGQPLPPLVREQFRVAGLSHLLVASGAQVSLAALLVLGIFRVLGWRSGWVLLLVLPVLLLYALITGGAPSIWRATCAGLCLAAAWMWGRPMDALSLWSMALVILLLFDPLQLFDLSLQLTFAATWGLIVLSPALQNLWSGAPTGMARALSLLLGAQLATWPLIAYHFGRISLAGLGANVLGVPLAGVMVCSGALGLLFSPFNILNYQLASAITALATHSAQWPGAQITEVSLSLSATWGWYALLGLIAVAPLWMHTSWQEIARAARADWSNWRRQIGNNGRNFRRALILSGCLLLLVALNSLRPRRAELLMTVLDVGQGEAIFLQTPGGRTLLIDGGSSSTERGDVGRSVIVPYLQSRGVQKLDVVAVTHADADHCNGLPSVLEEVPAGLLLDGVMNTSPIGSTSDGATASDYASVRAVTSSRRIPRQQAVAGQMFDFGDGVRIYVLAPSRPPLKSDNDNALVLRVEYGHTSFLLTADIERDGEERLLRRGNLLPCTVLKVAHHGSRSSTHDRFLERARPNWAVISCGRYNSFGHPAPAVLGRLQNAGTRVQRTDLSGSIEVFSDGQTCRVQSFRGR